MPKVSFILPAYKRRFLKESIDSILGQTYRDFELVVVDDKSPEELYDAIKEYSWEKDVKYLPDGGRQWNVDGISVRYYQNAENLGGKDLVAAWNHAMEYATGEWCILASDDDRYMPDYLEEMLGLVQKYPRCDLVHARVFAIDEFGKRTGVSQPRSEYETQIQMAYYRAAGHYFQILPDFMFRISALEKSGGFENYPLAWYSDDATWIKLARHGVACSRKVLFEHRSFAQTISCRHDNIKTKIESGEMFRAWCRDYFLTLVPEDAEDEVLLPKLTLGMNRAVDTLAKTTIASASLLPWFKILFTVRVSSRLRRVFMYQRFPLLGKLRRLIPL